MIRLALISSSETAKIYGALSTRLHRANWTAFAPLDSGDLGQVFAPLVKSASVDTLFNEQTEDFDAIVIDADPITAKRLAKVAMESGKAVLFGEIGEECASMNETDTLLMPAHPWRFIPSIQAVKRSVDSGKLGNPGLLRIHRWLPEDSVALSASERIMPDVDLACWLFGNLPESVWSLQSAINKDYIQFHLGFSNGGMAMIDLVASLPAGGDYYSLTMIGSTGAAYADDHHNMNLLYNGGKPNAIRTNQGQAELVQQLQEFVNAIEEKRKMSVTLADTCRAIQVVGQVLESANTGQVIKGNNASV
ncbi:MAG: Gfo/Idh/MocA family oxidoreductase [Verrucomicrobiota bacterium]|nr:Gfo/Idh/MocA family oxidoreductase [Verrucomicrobiota bacterium]